jgi:hypothetical protein
MVVARSVSEVQAVPKKTVVTLVEAPMGSKSLVHFCGVTSWASSHSRRSEAVPPTTLAVGSAEKKRQRAFPV